MKRILVVAPHPDDETLGCGGTILKHNQGGDKLYWLIMTNISAKEGFSKDRVATRQSQINKVSSRYGFEKVFALNLPTTKLDILPRAKIVQMVEEVIETVRPDYIYLSFRNDVHSDHRVTFEALISATKTFRHPTIKKILMYEVISETEFAAPLEDNTFLPNSFSDITEYLDQKIKIMGIYKGEMGLHPFPRSAKNIKALATFRGSTAGVRYAEAFMVVKEIC